MPRTREKQLAKAHARRQAEKAAAARRRRVLAGVVGALIGVGAIIVGFSILGGDDAQPEASVSPTASVAPTIEPSEGGLPTKIGEVTPEGTIPAQIACDGQVPEGVTDPKPQFDRPPPPKKVLDEGTDYSAVVRTSCGTITIELLRKVAPQAVASFVFLAEEGFFDAMWFHRVVPGFVIQTGDPLGTGAGGPGYTFELEVDPELNYDHVGQVAMARAADPDSNGSQWFVTTGEASSLNQQYTIFGDVVEGLDVVEAIGEVATGGPNGDTPELAVYVESVTIERG